MNTFKEKRTGDSAAVSLKTYYAADDNGRWVNHLDGNPLTDWTNINAAEQQFSQIIDPNTGEPIILPGRRVLIAPQIQALSLNQLMQAQAVWKLTQGGQTPAAGLPSAGHSTGQNPLMDLDITMATSRQLIQAVACAMLDSSEADAAATGCTAIRRPSPTWRTGRSLRLYTNYPLYRNVPEMPQNRGLPAQRSV